MSSVERTPFKPLIFPNEDFDRASGSGLYATARSDSTGFRSCRTSDTNARSTGIVTGISNDNYVTPPSTGGYTNSRYMGPGGTRNSFQIGSDFDETLSGSRSSISNMSQQLSQITQSTGRSARSAPSEAASAAELQEITARNEWEKNIEQSQLPFSSQPDTQHELTEDEAGGGPNTSDVDIGELDIPLRPKPTFSGGDRRAVGTGRGGLHLPPGDLVGIGTSPEIAHKMRTTGVAPLRPSHYRPTGDLSYKEPSTKHQSGLNAQTEWRAIRQAVFDIILGCAGQALGVLLILAGLAALGYFVYSYMVNLDEFAKCARARKICERSG